MRFLLFLLCVTLPLAAAIAGSHSLFGGANEPGKSGTLKIKARVRPKTQIRLEPQHNNRVTLHLPTHPALRFQAAVAKTGSGETPLQWHELSAGKARIDLPLPHPPNELTVTLTPF